MIKGADCAAGCIMMGTAFVIDCIVMKAGMKRKVFFPENTGIHAKSRNTSGMLFVRGNLISLKILHSMNGRGCIIM